MRHSPHHKEFNDLDIRDSQQALQQNLKEHTREQQLFELCEHSGNKLTLSEDIACSRVLFYYSFLLFYTVQKNVCEFVNISIETSYMVHSVH